MASPQRIAANRRNAARSTGPVTTAGKMRASRNALKHGLNVSVRHDPETSNRIEALAVAIGGKNLTPQRLRAAREVAEAQLEIKRLQAFRLGLVESELIGVRQTTDAARSGAPKDRSEDIARHEYALAYARALPILTKLERYERKAHTRNERALRSFGVLTDE